MWVAASVSPNVPRAGDPVQLTVLTFYLTENRCWNDPSASRIPNATWYGDDVAPSKLGLRVRATHASGSAIVALLSQRSGNRAYWDGTMVFPTPGDWTLHVLRAPDYIESGDVASIRCGGFQRTVRVDSSALPQSDRGGSGEPRVSDPRVRLRLGRDRCL